MAAHQRTIASPKSGRVTLFKFKKYFFWRATVIGSDTLVNTIGIRLRAASPARSPNSRHGATASACRFRAMCGRLRVGKDFLHVLQHWSVQPCVRPFNAVHMTAGHNALRGSGPTKLSHSTMLWHEWVVLIAGSTGSALRAVRPPNLHITPVVLRDFVYRASATGSLYRSPLAIMAQTIRAILLASAIAATFVGRLATKAVSQGRCLVPWILA